MTLSKKKEKCRALKAQSRRQPGTVRSPGPDEGWWEDANKKLDESLSAISACSYEFKAATREAKDGLIFSGAAGEAAPGGEALPMKPWNLLAGTCTFCLKRYWKR
jgi:hypothetical protein